MDLVTLAAFHLNLLHTYRRSWEFGSRFGVTTAWLAMRFIFLTGGWWRRAMTDTYLLGVNSKEIKPVSPKGNQPWIFIGRTDTKAETPKLWPTWFEELTHLKRPWCWERLKAGGEGDDRGWHGWMASPTQWTRIWTNSGRWWWTGKSGMLQSMGSQRVRHDWLTEQQHIYIV